MDTRPYAPLANPGSLFVVYPRGFVGAHPGPRTEQRPKPGLPTITSVDSFVQALRAQPETFLFNQNVELLHNELIRCHPGLLSFDYHKRLLQTALSAFGTNSFTLWYAEQQRSPVYGDTHQRFLDDTLLFIEEGRREMHLETWETLLSYVDTGARPERVTARAKSFPYSSVKDVIRAWVAQPDGSEDLVRTLYLLFGAPKAS